MSLQLHSHISGQLKALFFLKFLAKAVFVVLIS